MEETDCPVCGSSRGRTAFFAKDNLLGHPGTFREVRCLRCGLLYLNPRPSPAEMAPYYSGGYAPFEKRPKSARRHSPFVRWLRMLAYRDCDLRTRIKKDAYGPRKGRVLDAGCGAGALLFRLKQLGWETCGVEIDTRAAREAERLGLDVRVGTIEQANFPDCHFDLLTAVHVLEHIHNPVGFLNEAWRVLKPGGLLYVEVPNARSFNFRTFRTEWFHLDAPRHLCSYSPEPLRYLLRAAGFRARKLRFISGSVGLRGSIRYYRRARGLGDWSWINGKTVKRLLGLFTFALDIARTGDVIRVDAVKTGKRYGLPQHRQSVEME